MKKKILIVFSVAIMAICLFSISVFASNYIPLDDYKMNANTYINYYYVTEAGAETPYEYDIGYVYISDCVNDEFVSIYGLVNVEEWHRMVKDLNFDDAGDFYDYFYIMSDSYPFFMDICNPYKIFWNLYSSYLAELEAPTYEDGYNKGLEDATFGSNALVNILNPAEFVKENAVSDGVNFILNSDGSYTLNGTAANSYLYLYDRVNTIHLDDGSYYFGGGVEGYIRILIYPVVDGVLGGALYYTYRDVLAKLTEGDYAILLYCEKGKVYNDFKANVVLNKIDSVPYGTEFKYSQEEYDINYNKGYLEYINGEEYKVKLENTATNAVEKFKGSNEYIDMYNGRYSEGYIAGVETFKDSPAYELEKETYKDIGRTEGVIDFKKSQEYSDSLTERYDQGYEDGVADTSGDVIESQGNAIFVSIFGVVLLVLVIVYFSKAKNKKRR